MKVDPEFRDLIPPLSAEEKAKLETNILEEGCRDALILWGEILIDGHNRYDICTRHGRDYRTVTMDFASRDDVKIWIINNQLGRRNLVPYTIATLVLQLEALIKAKAKERQIRKPDFVLQNSVEQKPIDTQKELAKAAGVSHDTIYKVKVIEEKATEEVKQKLSSGEVSINQVYTQIKRDTKEQAREVRREENRKIVATVEAPEQAIQARFATIVIDPPWDWGDEGDCNQLGRAKPDYSTLSIDDLINLNVAQLADDDCHLYLWITNRSLPKGFRLIDAWGFRYITALTWVKPHFGMGNYFRGQTEHILFAVKGRQPLKRKDVGTVFHASRGPNGHSSKPPEFLGLIESCSPGPYVEMFSRSSRPGWTTWGEPNGN